MQRRTCYSLLAFMLGLIQLVAAPWLVSIAFYEGGWHSLALWLGVPLVIGSTVLALWRLSAEGVRKETTQFTVMTVRRPGLARVGLIAAIIGGLATLLIPHALYIRDSANRVVNASNLCRLGIAMHDYHSQHNHLPAQAIYGQDGRPLLSWRVAILPYLGEQRLYEEFHLDEPWYSEHNLTLLPQMPKVFRRPMDHRGGDSMSHYQVLVGPGATFEDSRPRTLGELSFADGPSNTILIADAYMPVPWTKPEDLPFDPNGAAPPLNWQPGSRSQFCFGDASAHAIRLPHNDHGLRVLRQLITWNGGEIEDTSGIVD